MKHLLATTLLLAISTTALADKRSDLAFEIKEKNSYTQGLVVEHLMTIEVGPKCWDTLLDKNKALQSRVATVAHSLAKYGSAQTGGDDWRHLEDQSNNTKDKNRELVAARVNEIKGKLHVTVKVEGNDCDGQLWMKYFHEVATSLEAYPPKSGKAFVTINVLAKAKGVTVAVSPDGSTFTVTGARDIEAVAWDREIQNAFKKVSTKG